MSRLKDSWSLPLAFLAVGLCIFLSGMGAQFYQGIRFDQDIEGHLKRAADSNQPALAIQELEIAEGNMDAWGLCSSKKMDTCYTSIFYRTPDEDVGFWRTNLQQTQEDLEALPTDADQLVVSNILLKVRETLVDNGGQNGIHVTHPDGISLYPYNMSYMVWWLVGALLSLVGGIWLFVWMSRQ